MKNPNNNKSKNTSKNANNTKVSKNATANKTKGVVWDIEPILAGKSFDDWMKEINLNVESFKKFRSILNDNITPSKVLGIIKLEEEIVVGLSRVGTYYSLKFYANTKDSEALSKLGQLKQVGAEINNDLMFFSLWFMHLDEKVAKKILESKELTKYKYHLDEIRKASPYTKSEDVEKILHIKDITGGSAYADIYNIITNNYTFDWFGKELSKEEIVNYYRSENSKFRDKSYDLVLSKYKDDSTALSEIYKNIVTDWCNDGIKIRGYSSSIAIRNLNQDVTNKSVEALLKVVRKNSYLFHEYFKLKHSLSRKAGEKYPYSRNHLYAPFKTQSSKVYTFDESKSYVLDIFLKFDKRFHDKALKIFNENHIHSHPAQGKRGGAFCLSIAQELTPYVLLNHTDSIRDVFTMIHELGHGVHDLFSAEKQTDLERHAPLPVCETASVFAEMLLAERMLKESKDVEEKKYVLTQLLDNQWATVVRQAYFIIFELYAHEEIMKGVTKEALDEKYYDLLKEQFGDMQIPELFKHEWNYIPHIHETPFYCYAYAWGNLFVLALYDIYKREGKGFIEKYITLLSAGGSDSPINLMKALGIDAESEDFWQRGFDIMKGEIDELKKIAK